MHHPLNTNAHNLPICTEKVNTLQTQSKVEDVRRNLSSIILDFELLTNAESGWRRIQLH
jgi:hypothetical protein